MATLEHIHANPIMDQIENGVVEWVPSKTIRPIENLPLIFWRNGDQWDEVNLWAFEKARNSGVKLKTVNTQMEHLHKYANWLEAEQIDWRHFPILKAERVLVRFRGFLIDMRDRGVLSASTISSRMNAVIQFYRYANTRNFIDLKNMWVDKSVFISYYDSAGFQRTLQRITTDISIPNRARQGIRLEDGLLPISAEHQHALMRFTKDTGSEELYLMLLIGFYTGARLGTITTLRSQSLDRAMRSSIVKGVWSLPIGPGTGISTKFDVSGELMIPDIVMQLLMEYKTSRQHLDRVINANNENKSFLFLTRYSNPYTPKSIDREMVSLRRKGLAAGIKFLAKFKFHQTRATYGTWLTSLCLKVTSPKAAIEFVKRAMHHKHESTTFGYITFLEHTKAKIELSNAFSDAFFGVGNKVAENPND
ncbi:site-specific integrase [Polynucleobacter sp. Ross1-W9]|uniref:tyrosine-type recombinase/integrase n=1 Tax=Polynucleobacter parvulilacunae TaxID=1855631 RepID=UPI001C0C82B9|nr:site-specific integrase [Polynucleobacter parvulilacunae]MBU3557175.1 site-specific integrase [Polynucleobacter parvulilacunae]